MIAVEIIRRKSKVVGFYRLIMKAGLSNFRASSIKRIMKRIKAKDIEIIANRQKVALSKVDDKIYTRLI